MKEIYENIRIEGRVGTWYEIDRMYVNNELYILFEHEEYGDETANVLCKIPPIQKLLHVGKNDRCVVIPSDYEICETYDDIKTTLGDYGIEEPENYQNEALQDEIEQMSIVLDRMRKISREWKE